MGLLAFDLISSALGCMILYINGGINIKYDEGQGERLASNVGLLAFHSTSSAFVCITLYVNGGISLKYYEGQKSVMRQIRGC